MSMLDRFSDIIKSNINELLDRAEDPAKMVDQYLRDLTDDLAKVKQETAGVMAQEVHARNMYETNQKETPYLIFCKDIFFYSKKDGSLTIHPGLHL